MTEHQKEPWAEMERRWEKACGAAGRLRDLAVEAVEGYADLPVDQRRVAKARHEAFREATAVVDAALKGDE